MQEIVGNFDGSNVRVGVVTARFNAAITDRLVDGALDALHRHGVAKDRIVLVRVPGAFEIPSAARALLAADKVDGVVAVGCVIRGETSHYDYVCDAALGGIAAIGREMNKPITCGILTTENIQQALARAGGKIGNKGFEAAQALLECADLLEKIAR